MFNPGILRLNACHHNAWKNCRMHHHHPTTIPIQKATQKCLSIQDKCTTLTAMFVQASTQFPTERNWFAKLWTASTRVMILCMNHIMPCSRVSMMNKHTNSQIQMGHILSFWLPNATQTIVRQEKMLHDECFDATDKELQDLFRSGTFEFVSRDEALKQGKKIVLLTWVFRKKCHSSGEVHSFKACMCARGDLQRENCTTTKRLSGCSFRCQLLKGGPRLVFTSRTPSLKPLHPSPFTLNFRQDMSRPIQDPRTRQ